MNITFRALACFVLIFWPSVELRAAGETVFRVGINSDNSLLTGCDFDTGTGNIQQGVDLILEISVNNNAPTPQVTASSLQLCNGSTITLDHGWDLGMNTGIDGGDVIEALLPLGVLGKTQEILITAGAESNNGSDDTASALFHFGQPVPTLSTWALLILCGFLLVTALVLMRRNKRKLAVLALMGVTLVALTDGLIQTDGQIDDWAGVDPLITDPAGDKGSTDATDLLGLFVCPSGNQLAIRIDVRDAQNDAPVAVDDTATTSEETPITLDVIANDSDPDADDLMIIAFTQGNEGTVVQNLDGTLTYTPGLNQKGLDTFTYTIADPAGLTDDGLVTITTDGTNDGPEANDDVYTVDEDASNVILEPLSNDTDPDTGDILTITALGTLSEGGTATIVADGTQVNYTPASDFFGSESFSYTIADAAGVNDQGTITITINPINDDPTANADSYTLDEDAATTPLSVLDNDSFAPDTGETLTITDVSLPDNGGTATISGDNLSLDYTPAADFAGTETFTYTIGDGNGGNDSATVTITVNNLNDPPIALDDAYTVDEDSLGNSLNVLSNDTSAPDVGETLTITALGPTSDGGSAIIAAGGLSLDYAPAADFFGTETFTYTIADGNGGSASATVSITVNNTNDEPTATNDALSVDEDSAANVLDVLLNDTIAPDQGETLSITALGALDQGGLATIGGGGTQVDYTPAADFFGVETFTYTIADGNGGSQSATVSVTVNNLDDAVTATDDSFSSDADSATTSGDVLSNDTAPDGGLVVESVDATAVSGAPITDNGDGTFDYDPTGVAAFEALDDGENAGDSFTYTAADADADTDTATVNVTVNGVNDAPAANAVAETVNQNESVTITLSASDVDIEDLTFSIVAGPDHGSLGAITPITATTSQVTYTHDNSANFSDSFTFRANDGTVDSATATATLTITPNVAPLASNDGTLLAPLLVQENSFLDIDVAANDSDADGTLDLASVNPGNGTKGTSAALGGGIVRYTPGLNEIGADSFTYTIDDNDEATSNSATVFVTINDAPVADNETVALAEATNTTINVLTGDTDSDGTLDASTVTIVTDVGAGEGTTLVNADGTITYTAGAFVGSTSFTYTVEDNQGGVSNVASVSITVSPDPMASDDAYNVYGHTTVAVPSAIGLLANDTDDGTINAVAGTFATDNGGSITIAADGSFTYTTPGPLDATPPALAGTDSYTYTLQDNLLATDTATITFTYERVVWFVDNTNASGSEDGSQADPFNNLADAEAVAEMGHTIFIFAGDLTTTNQGDGITLLDGQELIGEAAGLSVDVDGVGAGTAIPIVAAGGRPRLTNFVGDVIIIADDNTVSGLQLEPQGAVGLATEPIGGGMIVAPTGEGSQKNDTTRSSFAVGHWRNRDRQSAPDMHKRRLGTTIISDLILELQDDFSQGLVFLDRNGTIDLSDITINGPVGLGGLLGILFQNCLVTADLSNIQVNGVRDSLILFENAGASFDIDGLNIDSDDGIGLLAVDSGTLNLTGATNTIDVAGSPALVIEDMAIGTDEVTLQNLTSDNCISGMSLLNVTGGALTVTGTTMISNMGEDGISIDSTTTPVTFQGPVTINTTTDDGIDLTDVTQVTFNNTVTVMMPGDDGIDLQDADGAVTFASTVTISDATDSGIELNGNNSGLATGSTRFQGTVDIDRCGFAGLHVFDIHNTISFASLDIDSDGVGGVIHSGDIQGTFSFTQLDVDGDDLMAVGLGMDGADGPITVSGGTIQNIDGENLGLINSTVTLDYTGTLDQDNIEVPIILVDNNDNSMATFQAASTIRASAGSGIDLLNALGTYTFNSPISVEGNDDAGIDIDASSVGTFTFANTITLTTEGGDAFTYASAAPGSLNITGDLDITTTTGAGFEAIGSGSLQATGTNTIETTTGNPLTITGHSLLAGGFNLQSVNATGGTITLGNTGTVGSINITGTAATAGSGGTLDGGATAISIGGDGDIRFDIRNMNLHNFTMDGAAVEALENGSAHGSFTNMDLNALGSSGFSLRGSGAALAALTYDVRVGVTNSNVQGTTQAVLLDADRTTNPAGNVSLTFTDNTTNNTTDGITVTSADSATVCLDARNNNPMTNPGSDFNLFQSDTSTLGISQASTAALGTANDGATATVTPVGVITFNSVCPVP